MTENDAPSQLSPKKTYRLMMGAALLIGVLLAGIIYSMSFSSSQPMASSLPSPSLQSTHRKELPHFEYLNGQQKLTPASFKGRWTLFSFWSATCPPCLIEMPSLNQLALEWQGPGFEILTVNVDKAGSDEQSMAKEFLSSQDLVLPTLFDGDGKLVSAFQVDVFPTHFLVDPQGEIIWQESSAFNWNTQETKDQLLKLMEQLAPDQDQLQDPNLQE